MLWYLSLYLQRYNNDKIRRKNTVCLHIAFALICFLITTHRCNLCLFIEATFILKMYITFTWTGKMQRFEWMLNSRFHMFSLSWMKIQKANFGSFILMNIPTLCSGWMAHTLQGDINMLLLFTKEILLLLNRIIGIYSFAESVCITK